MKYCRYSFLPHESGTWNNSTEGVPEGEPSKAGLSTYKKIGTIPPILGIIGYLLSEELQLQKGFILVSATFNSGCLAQLAGAG